MQCGNQEQRVMNPYTTKAFATVRSTWSTIAQNFTLGWGGPAAAVAEDYPFVAEGLLRIGTSLQTDMPLLIFLNRESPPTQAAVAIPYIRGADAYNSRLLALHPSTPVQAQTLAAFSQAVWFLIGTGSLPAPEHGPSFQRELLALTGPSLFAL
jgi:hypothetical protein